MGVIQQGLLYCRKQHSPTRAGQVSSKAALKAKLRSNAGKLSYYAALTVLAVALVSLTPQMHQQTDDAVQLATGNNTAPQQTSSMGQSIHSLAPLLGVNEGLLRSSDYSISGILASWPIRLRQHSKHSTRVHNWQSSHALSQPTAPHAASAHYRAPAAFSHIPSATFAYLSEQNRQLKSQLAAATQTARLYDDTQLRLAEIESDLARSAEENGQLSAHLLAAVRQLSASNKTFIPPHAKQQQYSAANWQCVVPSMIVLLGMAAAWWQQAQAKQRASQLVAVRVQQMETEVCSLCTHVWICHLRLH